MPRFVASFQFASRLAAFATAVTLCMSASAQVAPENPLPDKPLGAADGLRPLDEVPVQTLPELDMKTIEEEDAQLVRGEAAPRYAIPHAAEITPDNGGLWELLPNGKQVWRLRAACPNAVSMNLGFTTFKLPDSAALFIYTPGVDFVIRPFTAADNQAHMQLWTPPVPGNEVVIELSVDANQANQVQLTLGSINAGYRGFKQTALAALSGSCNVDVVCADGDDWRDQISGVAVISTGGSTFCTGFMVNNVRQDLTPYFMTANHCGVSGSNAPSLVAFWNYENSWCRPPNSPASGGAGDGQLNQFNTGSTFLASSSASDFTLVRLNSSPNPTWFVSFLGWDARNVDATSSCGIHHPNTDEKRISFDFDPATTTNYSSSTPTPTGTHVRVANWEVGTTEPGSSGSPIFNQDKRVTGQLHGGSASCTSITNDFYGKFAVSWLGGGTPSTQLKTWLDPDDTGTLFVDTLSTRGMTITPSNNVTHVGLVGGPFSGLPYTYALSNSTASAISYEVSLGAGSGDLLVNGGSSASGSVASGGSANVTISAGPSLASAPAGIYTRDIEFRDVSNGSVRTITHSIEIGQTGIELTPATGLVASGAVGGPFPGSTTYTITSTRPSPVDVQVAASVSWISVDGSTSPLNFTLNGTGDSRTVVIGISSDAAALAAGVYSGSVSISNTSGGPGSGTRNVSLEVGRLVYVADDTPRAISDNSSFLSAVNVAEDFCIGDIDVQVDISHTYRGDLLLELTSPSGTVVTLHNRSGGSAENLVVTYDQEAGPDADGPGTLGDFEFGPAQGVWTLRVADQAGGDTGTLNSWSLRLVPVGGSCPTPEVVHYEPLDVNPGWSTEGEWGFGVPGGGADPSSGYTGSNVYGYNLTGNYPNGMPEYHLTSTAFDCSGVTNTRVSFARWLGVESSQWDKAKFSVSNDGVNWTTVWQNGSTLNESAWTVVNYDISAVADNQPTVFLRWSLGPTDSSVTYEGWNIDDIAISGLLPQNNCPADLDGNGTVDAADIGAILLSFGSCDGCPADLDENGTVDAADIGLVLIGYGDCP
ncbi:MAG: hypothetical protein RLZZ558_1853 [Planctomycetota bacterium]|jgi:subtilisin-like proprotein convertase family protein